MKAKYRGHEVEAHREKCMAGYPLLYWSIFRLHDMYEVTSGFEDSGHTVRERIAQLKAQVDDEIAEAEQIERAGAEAYVDECLRIMGQTLAPDVRESVIAKILKALPQPSWGKRQKGARS